MLSMKPSLCSAFMVLLQQPPKRLASPNLIAQRSWKSRADLLGSRLRKKLPPQNKKHTGTLGTKADFQSFDPRSADLLSETPHGLAPKDNHMYNPRTCEGTKRSSRASRFSSHQAVPNVDLGPRNLHRNSAASVDCAAQRTHCRASDSARRTCLLDH